MTLSISTIARSIAQDMDCEDCALDIAMVLSHSAIIFDKTTSDIDLPSYLISNIQETITEEECKRVIKYLNLSQHTMIRKITPMCRRLGINQAEELTTIIRHHDKGKEEIFYGYEPPKKITASQVEKLFFLFQCIQSHSSTKSARSVVQEC